MKNYRVGTLLLIAAFQIHQTEAAHFYDPLQPGIAQFGPTLFMACAYTGESNIISSSTPLNLSTSYGDSSTRQPIKQITMNAFETGTNTISDGIPSSVENITLFAARDGTNTISGKIPSSVKTITLQTEGGGQNIITSNIPSTVEVINVLTCNGGTNSIVGKISPSVKVNKTTNCNMPGLWE